MDVGPQLTGHRAWAVDVCNACRPCTVWPQSSHLPTCTEAGSNLYVGSYGTGMLTISGGGSVSDTVASIGSGSGSGTVTVGGGTGSSVWTNSSFLYVGSSAAGTLNITGGGSVSDAAAIVGNSSNIVGTITVGGGVGLSTWTNSTYLWLGPFGTGLLNINTGGLVSTASLLGSSGASSININGGTLQITASNTASITMILSPGGGTLDVPTAGTNFTVASIISGAGGLQKTGQATLTLAGANVYTGTTTVSSGTLKFQGSGSIAASPTIALAAGTTLDVGSATGGANFSGGRFALVSGQTLMGAGTVVGAINVLNGATVAPGNSVGILNVSSIAFTSAFSFFHPEIDFASAGRADLLNVTGGVSLASSVLNLSLLNFTGSDLPKTFLLVSNDETDPVTGTFGAIVGLPPGYSASVDYAFTGFDTLGRVGDGNDIAVTITLVPEPNTVFLGGVGLVVLALTTRRQRMKIWCPARRSLRVGDVSHSTQ